LAGGAGHLSIEDYVSDMKGEQLQVDLDDAINTVVDEAANSLGG